MHSLVVDLATTPLTNAGSTNNTYSIRFGLTPLPGNVTNAVTTTNYVTDSQQVTSATAAKYRVLIYYYSADTNNGYYAPPAALIQIFWPANAPNNSYSGCYESYATFPTYSL